MKWLYLFAIETSNLLLPFFALFSSKLKLFVNGRKDVFSILEKNIKHADATIWIHAASLGEYEQGLPIMEALKIKYPNHKLVLTFFSPSGYEVRKNNKIADVTVYLPLDTCKNAQKFIKLVHPEKVFFIKYEFWPHYLRELRQQGITTYLVSGIFRKNQIFFKWYGGFYRTILKSFSYFFVQNESSKQLLQQIGYTNCKISGDTRFDRVAAIRNQYRELAWIEKFKENKTLIVCGSTWPKDEKLLAAVINQSSPHIKWIVAPHNIKPQQIAQFQSELNATNLLYSKACNDSIGAASVLIIDNIGMLTQLYRYADIAYVGGGFGNPGVHNVLEPAVFGIPIIIGPNFSHFAEATALVQSKGCTSIESPQECLELLEKWTQNEDERQEAGHICSTFVMMNKGATDTIIKQIES